MPSRLHRNYQNWKCCNLLTNTTTVVAQETGFVVGDGRQAGIPFSGSAIREEEYPRSYPQHPNQQENRSNEPPTQHPTNRPCDFTSMTISLTHFPAVTSATQQRHKKTIKMKGVAWCVLHARPEHRTRLRKNDDWPFSPKKQDFLSTPWANTMRSLTVLGNTAHEYNQTEYPSHR